jgi:hypothetical protein
VSRESTAELRARGDSLRVTDGVDVVEVLALSAMFELFDSLAGPERAIEDVIDLGGTGDRARVLGWSRANDAGVPDGGCTGRAVGHAELDHPAIARDEARRAQLPALETRRR